MNVDTMATPVIVDSVTEISESSQSAISQNALIMLY